LFSQADTFGYDKQGRITLPEKLRTHAALRGNQALLVGSYVTFNIWSPKRYQLYHTEPFNEKNEMAALLQQLGL
jgi:DNA-binding transcriptional regulator/RsmH inhibitor MraZ